MPYPHCSPQRPYPSSTSHCTQAEGENLLKVSIPAGLYGQARIQCPPNVVSHSAALRSLPDCISVTCCWRPGCSPLRGPGPQGQHGGRGPLRWRPHEHSHSDTRIMEEGSRGKCAPRFASRPQIHHQELDQCYHPDFWPKSRMGRTLPGETKVGRGKHSGTSQLILLKS